MVYTSENIDNLLERRYIGQKIRRGGGRTKGPKKRTREDDERFEAAFGKMLDRHHVASKHNGFEGNADAHLKRTVMGRESKEGWTQNGSVSVNGREW
jgi:hypothetical protein